MEGVANGSQDTVAACLDTTCRRQRHTYTLVSGQRSRYKYPTTDCPYTSPCILRSFETPRSHTHASINDRIHHNGSASRNDRRRSSLGSLLQNRHPLHPNLLRLLLAHHPRRRSRLLRLQHTQIRSCIFHACHPGRRRVLHPMVGRGLLARVRRGQRGDWRFQVCFS